MAMLRLNDVSPFGKAFEVSTQNITKEYVSMRDKQKDVIDKEYFFEALPWEKLRQDVKTVNADLAKIIDEIDPPKKLKLIKASYFFGDIIVKDGVSFLRKDPHTFINTLNTSGLLEEDLSYSPIPLFLTLNKSNEVFIDTGSRIIPLNMFYAGSLLGAFESMDFMYSYPSASKWCVSAGARSLFLLPKISEKKGLKKLSSILNLHNDMDLRKLSNHWDFCKNIANLPEFQQDWLNNIMFFSKEWMIKIKNDPAFSELKNYLIKSAWFQAQFAISRIELSLGWESFVDAISSRNLKPIPYLADQTKHILSIAAGKSPGFRPSDGKDTVAPINLIQKTIIEAYSLKDYIPTMMHPCPTSYNQELPVYYSLFYPTLLEGSPNKIGGSTIMLDQKWLKQIIETLSRAYSASTKFKNNVVETTKFEYFHVEEDKEKLIKSSKLIPELDKTLLSEAHKFPNLHFCSTAPFWRGCIMIQKIKPIA